MTDYAERILAAIKAADTAGSPMPSLRELCAACSIPSTSIAAYTLRGLEREGHLIIGNKGHSRSYRLRQTRVDELESALRQMRRWIENEDRPGEWTAEIYELAGKLLPY